MTIMRSTPVTPKSTPAGKLTIGQARVKENEDAVNGVFGLGAFALLMVKQPADAMAVSLHGPKISHEIAVLAETNETFANLIKYITTAGPYAALATAVMPLAMQLAINHGKMTADAIPMEAIHSKEDLLESYEAGIHKADADLADAA